MSASAPVLPDVPKIQSYGTGFWQQEERAFMNPGPSSSIIIAATGRALGGR